MKVKKHLQIFPQKNTSRNQRQNKKRDWAHHALHRGYNISSIHCLTTEVTPISLFQEAVHNIWIDGWTFSVANSVFLKTASFQSKVTKNIASTLESKVTKKSPP